MPEDLDAEIAYMRQLGEMLNTPEGAAARRAALESAHQTQVLSEQYGLPNRTPAYQVEAIAQGMTPQEAINLQGALQVGPDQDIVPGTGMTAGQVVEMGLTIAPGIIAPEPSQQVTDALPGIEAPLLVGMGFGANPVSGIWWALALGMKPRGRKPGRLSWPGGFSV